YEVTLEGVVNNEDEFFESYLKISPDEEIEIIHEDPIKGGVQVLVSPRTKDIFLNALKDQKIDHKLVVEDVGRVSRGQDIPMIIITESIRRKKNKNKPVIFIEA
ncbi:hypothetical protein Anas_04939, partial [Armadillidium nasatum]